MAPKQRTTASADAPSTTTSAPAPVRSTKAKANNTDAAAIAQGIWDKYVSKTPQRTKLLDTFLAFLVIVGALQFLYVVLVGNFVRCLLSLLPNVLHHACKGTELEPLANTLQPLCASRQTRRTRCTLRTYRMSGLLQTSSLAACYCTSSV
jgi:hypothetical protein